MTTTSRLRLLILLLPATIVISLVAGCSGGADGAGEAMLARIDSLQKVADSKTAEYEDLSMFVNTVAMSLDSISSQEALLFNVVDPEKGPTTREQIRARIDAFSKLIERQQQTISRLSDSLKAKGNGANTAQIEKLNGIIAYLNQQLSSKEAEVRRIQKDLSNSCLLYTSRCV